MLDLLSQYVSRINAHSLLSRALARVSGSGAPTSLDSANLPLVLQRLQVSAPLFISSERRDDFLSKLQAFPGRAVSAVRSLECETITVRAEGDIVVARTRARIMCEELGAGRVSAHKVATVVSELARNIVSYTPGGTVELIPELSPRAIAVCAKDRGSGIRGLTQIMDGDYRSKTGLGLGLVGSKRLADDFQIDTGSAGTTVTARMRV